MSLLWRSWLAFVAVIATALAVLAFLSTLQHDAILARLIQERLAVVAQTTASSFRSVVDLGLPISMMRNAETVLKRARDIDPGISVIRVINPSGIVVYSTADEPVAKVERNVLQAMELSTTNGWSLDAGDQLDSGYTITRRNGNPVGAVVVVYPKHDFTAKSDAMARRIAGAAAILLVGFSILAVVILRLRLAGAMRGLSRIQWIFERLRGGRSLENERGANAADAPDYGFLGNDIQLLEGELNKSDQNFAAARSELTELGAEFSQADQSVVNEGKAGATELAGSVDSPLARTLARGLTPWAVLLVFGSALLLGYFVYTSVERSFQPEVAARSKLIGTVANNNIQRAVSSGVPLEKLVGAEQYFGDLLKNFPEISYFGVATGRIILEAGTRQKSIFGPERSRKDVPTFPITANGEQIGYIIVDTDPEYFALQFRDVLLDFAVVVLVVILMAFQILMVMISRSLTSPFVRLHYLAGLQAAGDFSKVTRARGASAIDQMCRLLSERSMELYGALAALSSKLTVRKKINAMKRIQKRFGLTGSRPGNLQFAYLNDVRIPLFLFAAADELPLSFFPLYARAADNPMTWLDQGVVISLPLAGYLLAIMVGSPLARPLAERFGHRNLLLFAAAPTVLAHIGLYLSTNVIEIILFRTITGFGYAIATLACQDYVLDVVPREQRNRALGLFTAALFSGIFAGTAIGGVLADRLGQDTVFAISAGLVLISGVLTFRIVPEHRPAMHDQGRTLRHYVPPIWQPLHSFRFVSLLLGVAIPAGVLLQAFISYLVALQMEDIGASVADTGRVLMVYFLAIALIAPVSGRLLDYRLQPDQVALAGAMISGLSLLAPVFWPTQWSMLVAVGGAGIAHGLIRDTQVAIAMDIAEHDLSDIGTSAVLGSLRTLERGASIVGLICIALLSSFAGFASAIGAVAIWILVGAAIFAIATVLSRRTVTAST